MDYWRVKNGVFQDYCCPLHFVLKDYLGSPESSWVLFLWVMNQGKAENKRTIIHLQSVLLLSSRLKNSAVPVKIFKKILPDADVSIVY